MPALSYPPSLPFLLSTASGKLRFPVVCFSSDTINNLSLLSVSPATRNARFHTTETGWSFPAAIARITQHSTQHSKRPLKFSGSAHMQLAVLPRRSLFLVLAQLLSVAILISTAQSAEHTGPWNLPALKQTPAAEFGPAEGLVRPVYYAGEPFLGQPTRIFAWYAQPAGDGPFPAMVLVHGGGGKAFRDWALHWANRGYAAIAMDLAGHGPAGRLPDGGPDQSDETKFKDFTGDAVKDMWSYHAVAAVIRGQIGRAHV